MEEKFGIVVILGLAVFGAMYILSAEFDTAPSPGEQDHMILHEQEVGQLGDETQDFRLEEFGEITVGRTRGDIQVFRDRSETISDRFFGGHKIAFDYNATSPEGGEIEFTVLGSQGNGQVYAKVNGEKIFEEYMIASTQTIEIPSQHLNPGNNRIEIGANRDGIIGLFNNVEYSLEDIEVRINDRTHHDHRDNFQMYQYELDNFVSGELNFEIPPDASVRNEPLTIEVNDRTVSQHPRSQGEYEIDINPQNADLTRGFNTIRFSTGQNSEYRLENTDLTINYVGTRETEKLETNFELNETQLTYAQQEETKEYIEFDYSTNMPSRNDLQITINNNTLTHEPETGRNRVDISQNLQQNNYLTIESDGTYTLRNFQITSRKEQEQAR